MNFMEAERKKEKLRLYRTGKHLTEKTKRKISLSMKGKTKSESHKRNISKCRKGIIFSIETKSKLRNALLGKPPICAGWNKNQTFSDETRKKMRLSKIKYVEKQRLNGMPLFPTAGNYEKSSLDILENIFNYTVLRQYKVSGFFLDGYCPALKLAIEIDEEKHFKNGIYKQGELQRQRIIEKELNCQFLRISTRGESNGRFYASC